MRRRSTWVLMSLVACGDPSPSPSEGADELGSESESGSTTDSTTTGSTNSTTTDSTSSESTDSTTGDPQPDCQPLVHAPPATVIDGLPAVAIDILGLEGLMRFDLASQTAQVEVTMTFQLGPDAGMPIFDLRQSISEAELDGRPLDPQLLESHDFGKGITHGFRILEQDLDACSIYTLALRYPLALPNAPLAGGLNWWDEPARLSFDTWLSDLNPGRYLESWLPANLPFDHHPLSLGVTLTNAGIAHTLITNAALEELGEHDWQLEFPDSMRAMSPLIVVVPSADVELAAGIHAAANGQDIPYFVYRHKTVFLPVTSFETDLRSHLDAFVLSVGDFEHPAMTVYIGALLRGMEYDGALTTGPEDLEHEAFHSWWGRGVHPATYTDGWIDEAWAIYSTSGASFTTQPFVWEDEAVTLYDPHPFARETAFLSYTHGQRVFAGLAAILGVAELRAAMAELYGSVDPLGTLTTAELEQHLYCTGGELPDIRQAFWQFVYGQGGPVDAAPLGYCD